MKKKSVAVVGATGNVGSNTINILHERGFPISQMYALASSRSVGKSISFGDERLNVINLDGFDFSNVDIAFFSAGSEVSRKYASKAVKQGCIVIDKSSLFRLDKNVPLVVPEVNPNAITSTSKIIATPNCCTIPIAVVLKPLDNAVKIKRVIISTYQSTSGAGKAGMDELYDQTKSRYFVQELTPKFFPQQIAFNLFPHIGDFGSDGYTSEEEKISLELMKVLGEHVKSSVTSVRVPTFIGHCMSVNVEFSGEMNAIDALELLHEADGVLIASDENTNGYHTPVDVVGEDAVFVSRVRNDHTSANTINLWIACDNLRKGAALNAVQIAELLL